MNEPEAPGEHEPKGFKSPDGPEASPDTGPEEPVSPGPGPEEPVSPGPRGEEPIEESPVPAQGERFGLKLGNPIESESAAFSWLIVVILAAISIGAVAKLISPQAAVIWTVILLGIVCVPIFRGLRHQLGSPDEDE